MRSNLLPLLAFSESWTADLRREYIGTQRLKCVPSLFVLLVPYRHTVQKEASSSQTSDRAGGKHNMSPVEAGL
jgi:hypothetical protein